MTAGEETVSAGRTELETPLYGENGLQIHIYAEAAKRAICCGPNNNDNNNNRENGGKLKRQRGVGRTGRISRKTEAGESSRHVLPHRLLAVRDLTGGKSVEVKVLDLPIPLPQKCTGVGLELGGGAWLRDHTRPGLGGPFPTPLLIPKGSALVCIPPKTL